MNFRHGPGNIQGAPAQHRVYKEKLENWSQKIDWWGGSLPLVGEAEESGLRSRGINSWVEAAPTKTPTVSLNKRPNLLKLSLILRQFNAVQSSQIRRVNSI